MATVLSIFSLFALLMSLFLQRTIGDTAPDSGIATATFYGGGLQGGACGFGDVVSAGYGNAITAAGPRLWLGGTTCGACFRVSCFNSSACRPGASITVPVVDECPAGAGWCCPNCVHFDLNTVAFNFIAQPEAGHVQVQYQRVPCLFSGAMRFAVLGSNHWLSLLPARVGGPGTVSSIQLRDSSGRDWQAMRRQWGAVWIYDANEGGNAPLQPPVDFRVTAGSGGQTVRTGGGCLPDGWSAGPLSCAVQFDNQVSDGGDSSSNSGDGGDSNGGGESTSGYSSMAGRGIQRLPVVGGKRKSPSSGSSHSHSIVMKSGESTGHSSGSSHKSSSSSKKKNTTSSSHSSSPSKRSSSSSRSSPSKRSSNINNNPSKKTSSHHKHRRTFMSGLVLQKGSSTGVERSQSSDRKKTTSSKSKDMRSSSSKKKKSSSSKKKKTSSSGKKKKTSSKKKSSSSKKKSSSSSKKSSSSSSKKSSSSHKKSSSISSKKSSSSHKKSSSSSSKKSSSSSEKGSSSRDSVRVPKSVSNTADRWKQALHFSRMTHVYSE